MAERVSVRAVGIAVATVLAAVSVGCATPTAPDSSPTSAATSAAAEAPASEPELATRGAVTVIERDGRVTLCLGGVLLSYPPGCGGPELIGWDWDALPAPFEHHADVRWGDFGVAGAYDAEERTFTVSEITAPVPPPEVDPMGPVIPTACEEPDGGWRIVDGAKATYEASLSASAVAGSLEGYATMWVDRSLVPPVPDDADPLEVMRLNAVHAGSHILTVALRGDTAEAERRIREVWGGPLCVIEVSFTEEETQALVVDVIERAQQTHEVTGAGPDPFTGTIDVSVVYDADGALQRALDAEYGAGTVRVHSALVEVR